MSSGTIGRIIQIGGIVASFSPLGWYIKAGVFIGTQLLGGYLRGRGMAGKQEHGVRANVMSNEAGLGVIYGRTKVGIQISDVRVDPASVDNKVLYLVGCFGLASENGGGIEAVESIYLDDRLAVSSPAFESEPNETGIQSPFKIGTAPFEVFFLRYGLHAGANTQTVDAMLNTAFSSAYNTAVVGKGIAYVALQLTHHESVYPTGIPEVTAIVKGQKVYDPRTSTWGWSDNPALCVLDYLTSKRYGMGALYSERDGGSRSEIDEDSFKSAANYCDTSLTSPGGNHARFTCNGRLDTGRSKVDNLEDLLAACRGEIVYQGGKFRLFIRQPTTPTTFALTEDNIVGEFEYFRAGIEQVPNRVIAHFIDEDNNWSPQQVTWPEANQTNAFLTNDSSFESILEIQLPFTENYYRAQKIAMVMLRESREDLTLTMTANQEALKLQVGDVVPVTHSRPGWNQKSFWVMAMGLAPDGNVRLLLREYDSAAYNLDAQNTKDTIPADGLPDVRNVAVPTGVAALSDATTALVTQEGQVQPRIHLSWTRADHAFLAYYEVQVREATTGTYRSAAPDPLRDDLEVFVGGVTAGDDYDIRLRAVNSLGVPSEWVEIAGHTVGTASTNLSAASITDGILPLVRGGTGAALSLSTTKQDLIVGAPDGSVLSAVTHPGAADKILKTTSAGFQFADASVGSHALGTSGGVHTGTLPLSDLGGAAPQGLIRATAAGTAWEITSLGSVGDVLMMKAGTPNNVWEAHTLVAADIPNLTASKITSGVFDSARIPDLPASKITAGTFASGAYAFGGGKVTFGAAVAAYASINLPHGTAPTTPANGDVWTTTAGVHARVNGATRNLLSASDLIAGTLAVARGGTGLVTLAQYGILVGNGTSALNQVASPDGGGDAFLKWNDTPNTFTWGGLSASDIPNLDAAKIASGIFAAARIPTLDATTKLSAGPNDTFLVTRAGAVAWGALVAADIPSLDAGKITTGTLATARIPSLDASKIGSGTLANARISQASVTQYQAALTILESQITDGTVLARLASNETITGVWGHSVHDYGSKTTATNIDALNGNIQRITLGASITLTPTNFTSGRTVRLYIEYGGAHTPTFSGVDTGDFGTFAWSSNATKADVVTLEKVGSITFMYPNGTGFANPT